MTISSSNQEDITVDNDIVFKAKKFPTKRNHAILETITIEAHNILTWLNDKKIDQLHYVVVCAIVILLRILVLQKAM